MVWLALAAAVKAEETITNAMHAMRQPYNIEAFGAFRMLILGGRF